MWISERLKSQKNRRKNGPVLRVRTCGKFTMSSFGALHLGNVALTTQFPSEYCQAIRLP